MTVNTIGVLAKTFLVLYAVVMFSWAHRARQKDLARRRAQEAPTYAAPQQGAEDLFWNVLQQTIRRQQRRKHFLTMVGLFVVAGVVAGIVAAVILTMVR